MDTESVESGDDQYADEESSDQSSQTAGISKKTRKKNTSQTTVADVDDEILRIKSPDLQLKKPARLQGRYNDEYRLLLNEMIREANEPPHTSHVLLKNPSLAPSQIGFTVWSYEEKEALFHAVARYGRDDLPRLASTVQKSKQEVREYLILLRDGLLERANKRYGHVKSVAAKMPAAVELSEECCEALDIASEALSWNQLSWEAKQEQKEHGRFWLLNRDIAGELEIPSAVEAKSVEDSVSNIEDDSESSPSSSQRPESPGPVPSAALLRLSKFLELSENIFMSSTEPEWDWRSIADTDANYPRRKKFNSATSGAALFRTTFDDFHRLTVSLTRRIVHVALYQATSRLRATDDVLRPPNDDPKVEKRDVRAALHILGLKENSFEFWASLPRRRKLNWFYQKHQGNTKKQDVSAQEAEKYLRQERRRKLLDPESLAEDGDKEDVRSHYSADSGDIESESEASAVASESGNDSADSEVLPDAPKRSDTDHSIDIDRSHSGENIDQSSEAKPQPKRRQTEAQVQKSYHKYLEQLDSQNSKLYESTIWDRLGERPPKSVRAKLKSEELPRAPRAPVVDFRGAMRDWRDWTERRAEWERPEQEEGESSGDDKRDGGLDDEGGERRGLRFLQTQMDEGEREGADEDEREVSFDGDQLDDTPSHDSCHDSDNNPSHDSRHNSDNDSGGSGDSNSGKNGDINSNSDSGSNLDNASSDMQQSPPRLFSSNPNVIARNTRKRTRSSTTSSMESAARRARRARLREREDSQDSGTDTSGDHAGPDADDDDGARRDEGPEGEGFRHGMAEDDSEGDDGSREDLREDSVDSDMCEEEEEEEEEEDSGAESDEDGSDESE